MYGGSVEKTFAGPSKRRQEARRSNCIVSIVNFAWPRSLPVTAVIEVMAGGGPRSSIGQHCAYRYTDLYRVLIGYAFLPLLNVLPVAGYR
jgi:hypothetical protein